MTLLTLLLLPMAQAATCPETLAPEAFSKRVHGVRESVAFADPEAAKELETLHALLGGCVTGPLSREDIVALLLAEGAYEALREGGTAAKADRLLAWAVALGGAEAWDEAYGPDVQARFDAAVAKPKVTGKLDISFVVEPAVVSLDGEVIYEMGVRDVAAGMHVVQWLDGDKWKAEIVILDAGKRVTVGGGPPSADKVVVTPTNTTNNTNNNTNNNAVVVEEEPPPLPTGGLSVGLSAGFDAARAQLHYDGIGAELNLLRPTLALGVRYGDRLHGGLDARFSPASDSGMSYPRGLTLTGGYTLGGTFRASLDAGLAVAALPTVQDTAGEAGAGTFVHAQLAGSPALGGVARLELAGGNALIGSVAVEAQFLTGGFSIEAIPTMRVRVNRFQPSLGLHLGQLSRVGTGDPRYDRDEAFASYDHDLYRWIRLEGGLWYSF